MKMDIATCPDAGQREDGTEHIRTAGPTCACGAVPTRDLIWLDDVHVYAPGLTGGPAMDWPPPSVQPSDHGVEGAQTGPSAIEVVLPMPEVPVLPWHEQNRRINDLLMGRTRP